MNDSPSDERFSMLHSTISVIGWLQMQQISSVSQLPDIDAFTYKYSRFLRPTQKYAEVKLIA
jgi:hypothetical protein